MIELLSWLGDWVASFEFALLVSIFLLWFAGLPKALVKALGSIRTASVFGVEVQLTPENNEQLSHNFDQALSSLREETNNYLQMLDSRDILIGQIANAFRIELGRAAPGVKVRGRMALHVQDPLFAQVLLQATPYFSWTNNLIGDLTTRGRRKSVRYGLIGRVWRSHSSETMPAIEHTETALINTWGALPGEAKKYDGNPRWAVSLLIEDPVSMKPVGILYFDNKDGDVFHFDKTEVDVAKLTSERVCRLFSDENNFLNTKRIVGDFARSLDKIYVGIDVEE
ncbi:MAG: hypothetical protein ACFE0P_12705 [Oceanicaulis sp.]